MSIKPHYVVENHGTLYLLRPLTKHADLHLKDVVSSEATWLGGALVVEHRYIHDLCDGLVEDGWRVA